MRIEVPESSKAVQAKKRRRAKQGKCLLCDGVSKRRGLCFGHYMKYTRAKSKLGGVERLQFELQQIADGHILGVQEVRSLSEEAGQ